MKQIKKIVSIGIVAAMVLGSLSTAYAAEVPNKKEEVVYTTLSSTGDVNATYVVNKIYSDGEILDYGTYDSIRNMTTLDELDLSGDTVQGMTDADQLYYEGILSNTEIPWDIAIEYMIDGKSYPLDELTGKDGRMEMKIHIAKNEKCNTFFYDNYALQMSFTLDTQKFSNIEAEGATVANAGSNKQISYTILPGKGIEATVIADVIDFEMAAVTINGIRFNLNIDLDEEALLEQVEELVNATNDLNDGANEVNDGAEELKQGSSTLFDGTTELNEGMEELDDGIVTLQSGIVTMQDGLNSLNSKTGSLTAGSRQFMDALKVLRQSLTNTVISTDELSKLTTSSGKIKQGIADLYDGAAALQSNLSYEAYKTAMNQNGLNIDELVAGNNAAISALADQISELQASVVTIKSTSDYESNDGIKAKVQQLEGQIASLNQTTRLLSGNNAALSGVDSYLTAMSSGVDNIVSSLLNMKTSYEEFDSAIFSLTTKLSELAMNMSTLTSSISQLVQSYEKLDGGIKEYTDGVATIVSSYIQLVDGMSTLVTGSNKLLESTGELKNGTSELYDGILQLSDGTLQLAEGTSEFSEITSEMDVQAQEKLDSITGTLDNNHTDNLSFVSEKNVNISSVQFVMKTEAIEKTEVAEVETAQPEVLSFWQKLLRLFGLF